MEQKKETKKKELVSFGDMKPGDYSLHLYVESTRGLLKDSPTEPIDPIIKITAFGESKTGASKKGVVNTDETYWAEHFFFEKKVKDPKEIENDRIEVEVLDHKMKLTDALVGTFQIDLMSIFFAENRTIQH